MFTPQTLKPPTSADVAQAAGVSRATVSFVLNNKPDARVSDATRHRVQRAASELGYTPNVSAQALRAATPHGLVIPVAVRDFGTGFSSALELLSRSSGDDGLPVIVDSDRDRTITEAAAAWARYRPAAVIAESARCSPDATEILRRAGVLALLVITSTEVDYAPSVVLPQEPYGAIAIQHLAELGHTRIAVLQPGGAELEHLAGKRLSGAQIAGEELAISVDAIPVGNSVGSLRDWAHSLRYSRLAPTALFAPSDALAMAAVRALGLAGLRVPEDIAVVGADNLPIAQWTTPTITSVGFSAHELAASLRTGIRALLEGNTVDTIAAPELAVIRGEST